MRTDNVRAAALDTLDRQGLARLDVTGRSIDALRTTGQARSISPDTGEPVKLHFTGG